jgi:hypothetical protein
MPLIPDHIATNAALDSKTHIIAAHVENAIINANGMTADVLALDNETLAAWLNDFKAKDLESYLAAHYVMGENLNAIAARLEPEIGRTLPRVDISPFTDKVESQGRKLTFTNGVYGVETIQSPQSDT